MISANNFPLVGISSPKKDKKYAFVACVEREMRACPLHSYFKGITRDLYYVDCLGNKYDVSNIKLVSIDWLHLKEFGVITSTLAALLARFNFIMLTSFDIKKTGIVSIDELRTMLLKCVSDNPRYYAYRYKERHVIKLLKNAKTYKELMGALANIEP